MMISTSRGTRVASTSLTASRRHEEDHKKDPHDDHHAAYGGGTATPHKSNLSETNRHERDEQILFDADTHTYTIPSLSDLNLAATTTSVASVTEMYSSYFEEFDADKIITKNYAKWQSPSSKSPYKGKTRDAIKKQWDDERDLGTALHERIESWYNGETPKVDPKQHPEWTQFLAFEKEQGPKIIPFRTEWRIWSAKYRLAGTIDLVSKNKTATKGGQSSTYSLYDWKRTKHSIDKGAFSFRKYGRGPLGGVPDIHYNRYRLQLSLYKRILELHYGITISNMFVVRFHPNLIVGGSASSYQLVEVKDWPEYVDKLLAHRRKEIETELETNDTPSPPQKESQEEEEEQETTTGLEEAMGALNLEKHLLL